jgi:toxin secretion/phage lysis holin
MMEFLANVKVFLLSALGLLMTGISLTFGGWNEITITFVAVMVIDFLTGCLVAIVFKKSKKTDTGAYSSKVGLIGIIKKVGMVFMACIGGLADMILHTNFIRDAILYAFILNEFASIVENMGLMGIKLPPIVTKALDLLKAKSEDITK